MKCTLHNSTLKIPLILWLARAFTVAELSQAEIRNWKPNQSFSFFEIVSFLWDSVLNIDGNCETFEYLDWCRLTLKITWMTGVSNYFSRLVYPLCHSQQGGLVGRVITIPFCHQLPLTSFEWVRECVWTSEDETKFELTLFSLWN